MDLRNKTVFFLGDSITEGALASKCESIYHKVIERQVNCKTIVDGKSGTRIAKQHKASEIKAFDEYFLKRLLTHKEKVDFTIVFGGVNDFLHGDAPFGNIEDKTQETFCGCCYLLCNELKERYDDKVMFILPLHNISENNPYGEFNCKPVAGKRLREYALSIQKIAHSFGFKVLDLWEDKELNPNNEENREVFGDGLHPTDLGHSILAKRIIRFIEEI